MKWTRPLERFIELALTLWLYDLFLRPLFSSRDPRGLVRLLDSFQVETRRSVINTSQAGCPPCVVGRMLGLKFLHRSESRYAHTS